MNKNLDEYISAEERRLEETLKGKNRMQMDEILWEAEQKK